MRGSQGLLPYAEFWVTWVSIREAVLKCALHGTLPEAYIEWILLAKESILEMFSHLYCCSGLFRTHRIAGCVDHQRAPAQRVDVRGGETDPPLAARSRLLGHHQCVSYTQEFCSCVCPLHAGALLCMLHVH